MNKHIKNIIVALGCFIIFNLMLILVGIVIGEEFKESLKMALLGDIILGGVLVIVELLIHIE